ncbi:S8 family serine peptidase [Nocardioides sp.]|uniref:S8 family serine peptidase n=1 Tax=Nocardioides sp. TaxID=35761 RepID=UPI00356911E7
MGRASCGPGAGTSWPRCESTWWLRRATPLATRRPTPPTTGTWSVSPRCRSGVVGCRSSPTGAVGSTWRPLPVECVDRSVPSRGFARWAGTSMAAPQVSGQLALVIAAGADAKERQDALRKTAHEFGDDAPKEIKYGTVDLLASLRYHRAKS